MFRETHFMDHNLRAMDLAEKMAERRRQTLSASRTPAGKYRIARRLFALVVPARRRQVEGHA